jgi:hypothetical protein
MGATRVVLCRSRRGRADRRRIAVATGMGQHGAGLGLGLLNGLHSFSKPGARAADR